MAVELLVALAVAGVAFATRFGNEARRLRWARRQFGVDDARVLARVARRNAVGGSWYLAVAALALGMVARSAVPLWWASLVLLSAAAGSVSAVTAATSFHLLRR